MNTATNDGKVAVDQAQSDWANLKGKIQAKWDKFVDTDVESFRSNLDLISAKIQSTYGFTKEKAEQEYKDFRKTLDAQKASAQPAVDKAKLS